MSVFADGAVVICPVVVRILVKTPVEGDVDPIGLESSVELVIVKPD
jgi:hypothetical protein